MIGTGGIYRDVQEALLAQTRWIITTMTASVGTAVAATAVVVRLLTS